MSFSLLGPIHYAPPATTSKLLNNFFSKSPKESKSSKPTKIKTTLVISQERLAFPSTSYLREQSPPSYSESIYSTQGTSEDIRIAGGDEEDIIDSYFNIEEDEVEKRMQEWDEEIRQKKEHELKENDRRISEELKKMGL